MLFVYIGYSDNVTLQSFFFFLVTAVSLSGSGEGCWSIPQLHMDDSKVLP